MAKDLHHEAVKAALIKKGWKITKDPMTLIISLSLSYHIDLATESILL